VTAALNAAPDPFSVSLFMGLIAGSYPTRRSGRLQPVEALRH
jgi:ABC-type antimicrobial peptide transport system permease subunit